MKKVVLSSICILLFLSNNHVIAQNGLHFDGSNDYVQTSFLPPTGSKPRTIEAWIKAPYNSGPQAVVNWGTQSNSRRFSLGLFDGKLRVGLKGDNYNGSTVIADDKWHHIAVSFDPSNSPDYRVYIDGSCVDSFNMSSMANTGNTVKLRFGTRLDASTAFFEGVMDEVRVWDYARTTWQIKNNYNKEFCQSQKGLIAYHKFNQGSAGNSNSGVDESLDMTHRQNHGDLKSFSLNGSSSNWVSGANLSVGKSTRKVSVLSCNSYVIPGSKDTVYTSGTYYDKYTGAFGCDSTIEINLRVPKTTYNSFSTIACNFYVSPSKRDTYFKSGTYIDTVTNFRGCDSIITIDLEVDTGSFYAYSLRSCTQVLSPSKKYVWLRSGIYFDTLLNHNGCDSILEVKLIIDTTSYSNIKITRCTQYRSPSGKYLYTKSGFYKDTLTNYRGCDSVISIQLTINTSSQSTINLVSCKSITSPSGKYVWNKSGTYFDTIKNVAGCDSVIKAEVVIEIDLKSTISVTKCDFYESPSKRYTWLTSGTYTDTLSSKNGCDSLVTIQLTILPSSTSNIIVKSCSEYLTPSGKQLIKTTGLYTDTLKNHLGCDSIITIDYKFLGSRSTIKRAICSGVYVSPSGKYNYTVAGTYLDTITNSKGCDSVITIKLKVSGSATKTIYRTTCSSYTSPSGNYTWSTSGIYSDVIKTNLGCDSNLTIVLTVLSESDRQNSFSIKTCDPVTSPSGTYVWDSSGVFFDTIQSYHGCDSIIKYVIDYRSTESKIDASVCGFFVSPSGKYTWDSTGVYFDTIPNSKSCDSLITIDLTVLPIFDTLLSISDCNSVISPSGKFVIDKTGLYADTLAASSGCDSIINIDFRLNTPSYGTIEVKRCYSFKSPSGKYEWFESGSYFDTLVNSQGCDSIQTIDLTIDAPLVDLGDDKAICKRSETELKIRTARLDSIYWSTGESQSSILVNKTGTYWVDVFRYDCSVRDTVIVFESESDTCECKLFIPNSFTPSTSTLINDEYYVLSSCELTEFQLTVFDRWGSILFSTQDINEKWDGIKKNKPVESGAYYYVIKAKSINEDEFNENGILIINR